MTQVGLAQAADLGNVVVVRVGDGTTALSGAAAPVFLDTYSDTGTLVSTVSLPTAAAGVNQPVTLSGSATSEGALSRSADGRFLTFIGYGAAPGTAAVSSTAAAATPRVVARVDAAGAVETTTALTDAHSAASPRGAVTDDGSRFWTAGGNGGLRFATLGATTSTSIAAAPANVRVPGIFGGQLYLTSGSAPFVGVNTVGSGLPASTGQSAALLPGGQSVSPYGFVLLDRSAAVPGVDTLYVADDSATPTGGVVKFSFDGATWVQQGTFRPGGSGARGIAGVVDADGNAALVVTTSGGTGSLVRVTDTAAFNNPIAATGTTLAVGSANTVLRGVALAPDTVGTDPPIITSSPASSTVSAGQSATLRVSAVGAPPLSYQWFAGLGADTTTPVGSDSASYDTGALSVTSSFWVRVTNSFGVADSTTATVTVTPPPPAACEGTATAIGAVQGSGPASPVVGSTVTIRGEVVGDYAGPSPNLRGFYLQDAGDADPATSDGIFVFTTIAPELVAPGDKVEVTGTVAEFQDQTQVSADRVDPCDLPIDVTPADISLPIATADTFERYEGMLVRFPQALTVTEHFQLGRFGEVLVSSGGKLPQPTAIYRAGTPAVAAQQAANNLNQLIIDDATNAQNPDPIVFGRGGLPLSASNTLRGGDTVTGATGVLTYTWAGNAASGNAFRLRPVGSLNGAAAFEPVNARPATPPVVGGAVKVAGANLLNWFNTFGNACTFGVSGATAECRGAADTVELERQAAKEVAELNGLGADVVGVVEVENDGYGPTSALADLVSRLNATAGAGTWAYIDVDAATGTVDAAGDDAIKVGVIYRPAAVTPVAGGTRADTAGGDLWDRVPVAQTFTRNADGEKFTVVVNHFKSKGSCPTAAGDPNADQGDGQSCWNARRTAQAQRLAGWLTDVVVPAAGDPDLLMVGDFNSYAGEDPIAVLEAAGYVNLGKAFGGADAYSYVFDGQWGYLDYAFASASLRPQVSGTGEWHINSDEPSVLDYNTDFKTPGQVASLYAPDQYRNSDHDPVLVGLDLSSAPIASTVTLTSSANPAVFGADLIFTATVMRASGGPATGGTVSFTLRGVPLGSPVPVVDGVARSQPVRAFVAGSTPVVARYSGDARTTASQASLNEVVTYGIRILEPTTGPIRAGTTVAVRYQLLDASGRPLPDLVSLLLGLACQSTVSVSGAQSRNAGCGSYDPRTDTFTVRWATARNPLGAATITARVRYPDATPATTTSVGVTLTQR